MQMHVNALSDGRCHSIQPTSMVPPGPEKQPQLWTLHYSQSIALHSCDLRNVAFVSLEINMITI
jgi:hypothetical protein